MKALLDGEDADLENCWIAKTGYAVHGDDKLVHRTIMERILGRHLTRTEQVHHCNKDRLDNRRNNLRYCKDQKEHLTIHRELDAEEAGVSLDTHSYCSYHKQFEPIENFSRRRGTWNGLHNNCRKATNEYRKLKGLNLRKNRNKKGGPDACSA